MASVQEENFIFGAVNAFCEEAGLAPDSPIKQILISEAVVVDGPRSEFYVRAQKADGSDASLATRLAELRDDPATAKHFPGQKPTTVSAKMGIQNLSDSDRFDGIAKGTIKVVG
jgi:hypothetical protein